MLDYLRPKHTQPLVASPGYGECAFFSLDLIPVSGRTISKASAETESVKRGLRFMPSYRDAKLMAATLRDVLGALQPEISHSKSLEIIAKQFGFDKWNVLAARISSTDEQGQMLPEFQPATPILRIFSFPKATEFYCDLRGFSVDWRNADQGPVYMQVSREQSDPSSQ